MYEFSFDTTLHLNANLWPLARKYFISLVVLEIMRYLAGNVVPGIFCMSCSKSTSGPEVLPFLLTIGTCSYAVYDPFTHMSSLIVFYFPLKWFDLIERFSRLVIHIGKLRK